MAFRDEARMLAKWVDDNGSLEPRSKLTHGVYYLEKTNQYFYYYQGNASPISYSDMLEDVFAAVYYHELIDIDLEILDKLRKKFNNLESLDELRRAKVTANLAKFEDY